MENSYSFRATLTDPLLGNREVYLASLNDCNSLIAFLQNKIDLMGLPAPQFGILNLNLFIVYPDGTEAPVITG